MNLLSSPVNKFNVALGIMAFLCSSCSTMTSFVANATDANDLHDKASTILASDIVNQRNADKNNGIMRKTNHKKQDLGKMIVGASSSTITQHVVTQIQLGGDIGIDNVDKEHIVRNLKTAEKKNENNKNNKNNKNSKNSKKGKKLNIGTTKKPKGATKSPKNDKAYTNKIDKIGKRGKRGKKGTTNYQRSSAPTDHVTNTVVPTTTVSPTNMPSSQPSVSLYPSQAPTQPPTQSSSPPSFVPTAFPTLMPTTMPSSPKEWLQLGNDLQGEAANDRSGLSVALSSDGQTVAIGGIENDSNGRNSGHARIYAYDKGNDSWVLLGSEIVGQGAGDWAGRSVALSSDGRTVAVGSPFNDGNGTDSGHVRIFAYDKDNNAWILLGSSIYGQANGDFSGTSIALSSDGRTVAIGAYKNDDNGTDSGHVRIFSYDKDQNTWDLLGNALDGQAAGDNFGGPVALSSDGRTVAIGAYKNDDNGAESGHVRIFSYDKDNNTWILIGSALDGQAAGDRSGTSVALSSDGLTVAIGAPNTDGNGKRSSGRVRIFAYDKDNNTWILIGSALDGQAANDRSGTSVALSSDGLTVAIGAPQNAGGHVRIFGYDKANDTWELLGSTLDGQAAGDQSGSSVALSSDGRTVAIGAVYNDDNGANSGHYRVYTFS